MRQRRAWLAIAAVLVAAVLVGSCSSDDDSELGDEDRELGDEGQEPTGEDREPGGEEQEPGGEGEELEGVDIDLGGPYETDAGEPVVLEASYALEDQADTVAELDRIGRALERYHDANGSYPPAALAAPDGTPLLSWRVLILPFLGDEEAALYERFDLTEPWDDPANEELLEEMPSVYAGSDAEERPATQTAYAGIAGPKALFEEAASDLGGGISLDNVTDGASMTLAVGPVGPDVELPWTAPGDVDIDDQSTLGAADGLSGPGDEGTPLLFLDGAVRTMENTIDPADVHSWATIAGDSCIPPDGMALSFFAEWDLNDDGKFETPGSTATIDEVEAGEQPVRFRLTGGDGKTRTETTEVVGTA